MATRVGQGGKSCTASGAGTPDNPREAVIPDLWFDPVDLVQMRLLAKLPPGRRIRTMLDAQAFARALIRGRLRRLYPSASEHELSLKLLEEVERGNRTPPRS